MDSLIAKLNEAGIDIAPDFSGTFVRNGAQWFKGMSWMHNGNEYRAAHYGDFRKSVSLEWRSWDYGAEPVLTKKLDGFAKETEKNQREERIKLQSEVATEIEAAYMALPEGGELPPYLVRKKISSLFGAKLKPNDQGSPILWVPLMDCDGKIWNVQRIYSESLPDGKNKLFKKSARVQGLFYLLDTGPGHKKRYELIYVCEGFATAASVQMAVGPSATVICAFGANNLKPAAINIKKIFPTAAFIFCADDNKSNEANVQ